MTTHSPLDAFETALLGRLRSVIEVAAAEPPHPARRGPAVRRRRWITPAAAALVAAFAVVLGVRALWPTPAFAVTGTNDSEVVVKVARLDGADALERALAQRGIVADVIYLPPGKRCAEGRYVEAETSGVSLEIGVDRFTVTLAPHTVGPAHTFVLSAAVTPLPDGLRVVVGYGVALGAVGPCQVVDAG